MAASIGALELFPGKLYSAPESANDRPAAALIGVGGRGQHMAVHEASVFADVVAICDADLRRAEETRLAVLEATGMKPEVYQDYRRVLDRNDIDVIGNCTPDHWHTKINIDCCRAGKDIYAEKPLTLTVDEGGILSDVVQETGRVLQTGTQQRSHPLFRRATELVRGGRIGKLKQVAVIIPYYGPGGGPFPSRPTPPELNWNLWQGQAAEKPFCPERLNFRAWWDYGGGVACDWGQHHFDCAHWAMDMDGSGPLSVEGKGYSPTLWKPDCRNNPTTFAVRFEYPGGIELWCANIHDDRYYEDIIAGNVPKEVDAGIFAGAPEYVRTAQRCGIHFVGAQGRLFVSRDVLEVDGEDVTKDYWVPRWRINCCHHWANFLDCANSREKPICHVEIARHSVIPPHLVNIACRVPGKLRWDSKAERFVDSEEANRWISRDQRAPYQIQKS